MDALPTDVNAAAAQIEQDITQLEQQIAASHQNWSELTARRENSRPKATITRDALAQIDAADQELSARLTNVEAPKI